MKRDGCELKTGDCKNLLRMEPDNEYDLVFTSPPYEDARSYGMAFELKRQLWVDWALDIYIDCLRVCKGLVAWVVNGRTKNFAWSCVPFDLAIALRDKGYCVRKPALFHRQGIPGSGGPDWLRDDYEIIVCAQKRAAQLPWSDNTAMGHEPRYTSPRTATNRGTDGVRKSITYFDPELVNPGNVLSYTVGRGHMGWDGAHENEAPFPENLAAFFIASFCPPGGLVLDPFSGSGTTVCAAWHLGRRAVGIDIRESQTRLASTRLRGLTFAEQQAGQELLFP